MVSLSLVVLGGSFGVGILLRQRIALPPEPPPSAVPRVAPASALPAGSPAAVTRTLTVGTGGSDETGTGTRERPFRTIQHALSLAEPATTVVVTEGTYAEFLKTAKNGQPGRPIILRAQGKVVLTGDEQHARILELRHDYNHVEGFEFTGKDILLWMENADHNVIRGNFFHHADGECIRVKYQSTYNLLERNRIEDCGLGDFVRGGDGKNGEGIYIGTAPEQLYKNPTPVTDESNHNMVRNNTIATRGNECVDIKEGSSANVVELNDCTGQKDPESGGINSRGNKNVFRYNRSYGNVGAGIRLGGDERTDGTRNEAYGNELINNGTWALNVQRLPQGTICGNRARDNGSGFTNEEAVTNPPCAVPLPPPGVQSQ